MRDKDVVVCVVCISLFTYFVSVKIKATEHQNNARSRIQHCWFECKVKLTLISNMNDYNLQEANRRHMLAMFHTKEQATSSGS